MTEKHLHPVAILRVLRKTLLVYLLPLVQLLFARDWAALVSILWQELALFGVLSAISYAVYRACRWEIRSGQVVHLCWRLGIRLDRVLRGEELAALVIERPLWYRLLGASRITLYPAGQQKTMTLTLSRQDAEWLADQLLPLHEPIYHKPKGGEKLALTVLGANGLSTLALAVLALHQDQPYAPGASGAALAQLSRIAEFIARWLPVGAAWLLVLAGALFTLSLVRSTAQAAHYTVWHTETQLGSRGGLLNSYEMRLRRSELSCADVRRSPATWLLRFCPVYVTAGCCQPEMPLFVWREGSPLLHELLPDHLLPSDDPVDIDHRSLIFFLPAGIPCGLCLILSIVSTRVLPGLTLSLLLLTGFFVTLLAAAAVGYCNEDIRVQGGRIVLRRQHRFHLHCICVFHPEACLTVFQSPWAVLRQRATVTVTLPGKVRYKIRSVPLREIGSLEEQKEF